MISVQSHHLILATKSRSKLDSRTVLRSVKAPTLKLGAFHFQSLRFTIKDMKLLVLSPSAILLSLLGSALFISSGCSVYKSQGRKAFEEKAPNQMVGLTAMSATAESLEDTCWTQPANEALWRIPNDTHLAIQKISENEIQVCITEPTAATATMMDNH